MLRKTVKYKTHYLKIWPEFFNAVIEGRKKFEIRKNDRDFKSGDTLVLGEFEPKEKKYTGSACRVEIAYVLFEAPGLSPGYCILSF